MIAMLTRSVRFSFVTLLFALSLYALAESAFSASPRLARSEGLSACGSEEKPCLMEALTIQAEPSSAAPRLVVSEHATKMKLRVRS